MLFTKIASTIAHAAGHPAGSAMVEDLKFGGRGKIVDHGDRRFIKKK